jgi:hypothetical protein
MNAETELIIATLQRIESRQSRQDERIERIDEAIRGNGHPGLNTRIDRLEQTDQMRSFWMKALGVGIMGQIIIAVKGLIK